MHALKAHITVQLGSYGKEQHGAEVRRHDGQNIAGDSPLKHAQEQHGKQQVGHGSQNTVNGKQLYMTGAAHKLLAQLAKAGGKHKHINEHQVIAQLKVVDFN